MLRTIYEISNAKNTTEIAFVNSDGDIWCKFAVLKYLMDISISTEIFFTSLLSPGRIDFFPFE